MSSKQGFSLIEIIFVLMILAVTAAFAVPSFMTSIEQTKASTAKSNLLAIDAGQQKYYEDYASYCTAGCTTTTAINTMLHLNISDPVNYSCAVSGSAYTCTWNDGTDTLVLTPGNQPPVSCTVGGNSCPY